VSRRALLNLGLLAVLSALVAVIALAPAPTPPRLSDLDPDTVQRIEIERGEERIVLMRRGEVWWLLEPQELPGHAPQIEPLLRLPASAWSVRYAPAEVDLAAAGLQPPRRVLSFDGQRFALGGLEALGSRRYLRHGEWVYLIEDRVSALAAAPWWGFVHPDLRPDVEPVTAAVD